MSIQSSNLTGLVNLNEAKHSTSFYNSKFRIFSLPYKKLIDKKYVKLYNIHIFLF